MASPAVENEDSIATPDSYIVLDGYRLVRPYYFDFSCAVKKRMEGLTALQVMCKVRGATLRSNISCAGRSFRSAARHTTNPHTRLGACEWRVQMASINPSKPTTEYATSCTATNPPPSQHHPRLVAHA